MNRKNWNRIDKTTGQIFATTEAMVLRAAAECFSDCDIYADLGGRFQTPFAIYALSEKVSEAEWGMGSEAPAGARL